MSTSLVFTVTTDISHDQRMLRIAGTLSGAGYAVTLVGRELPDSSALLPKPFQQHRIKCWFLKGPFFYLEYNLRLVLWFWKHRFDVYGVVDADTALAGIFTIWWRRKPMVYDAHELFSEMPEVVERPVVKKVWAFLEKQAFAKATLAYTVSASLVQYFEKRYGREVALIRNMPIEQPLPAQRANSPFFIYQGALNIGRGLECTLRAMQEVPAQLIICGDGPLAAQLQQMAQELGLQEKVIFKGNVAPVALAQLTKEAYAGIMLLENKGLSYYYSLANKFFDYVQAGIPQICVPFPEYVQLNTEFEVALLVENQVEVVRDALLLLLEDRETYARLQQNCWQAREVWNWEQEGQRLVQLYKNMR